MVSTVRPGDSGQATAARRPVLGSSRRFGDSIFHSALIIFALSIVALALLVFYELWTGSKISRHELGLHFLTDRTWAPHSGKFGAYPFVFGTLVTSFVALLIAGPIGILTAICLNEYTPKWLGTPIGFIVELLAAIPSVIYGLWALGGLVPFMQRHVQPFLGSHFGSEKGWLNLELFKGPKYGVGILSASLVLAVMILPTATAISRDVFRALPRSLKEGGFALGATKSEVINGVLMPAARSGVIGALILALGRALGETMAVTMVIGNTPNISWRLFSLGDTMASMIATQFPEADSALFKSTLFEIGLLLFAITIVINSLARIMVWQLEKREGTKR